MFENLATLKGKWVRHFSHNDLDGYAPQALSKVSELVISDYKHCGYGSFNSELKKSIEFFESHDDLKPFAILITDIAPESKELVGRLDKLTKNGLTVVLLDHHDTNKWIAEEFPQWAWIDNQINNQLTCGTELYFLYLAEKGLLGESIASSNILKEFVELVRSYDTWDWSKTDNFTAKDLNTLLYSIGPSRFLINQLAKVANEKIKGKLKFYFEDEENLLINLENKKEEKYINSRMEQLKVCDWGIGDSSYKVGVVFADQFHSVLGNDLNRSFPELDFIAILDLNLGKGSLRTIHDHVHVGEIANEIAGGGGHPKAAGFEYNTEDILPGVQNALGIKIPKMMWVQKKIDNWFD
ncbi:phosphoesterase [Cytobacillus horneckiae]|uniref:DHH family phosphoesterase n=1 Tax=Cytobacillus horneckiae TaxID=549687 RepID=UPI0034CE62D1